MKLPPLLALSIAFATGAPSVTAHPEHGGTDSLVFSIFTVAAKSAGGDSAKNEVKITVEGDTRTVRSNGMPDHKPGQFPNRGNPNALAPQAYEFRMPTKPQPAPQPLFSGGSWYGVALNGVPFEPGTGEFWNGDRSWNYEALGGFINLGMDPNNAHVQPSGAYHYHALPDGLVSNLGGDGKVMRLVGWAADGFPIYSGYGPTDATAASSPLKKLRSSWQLKKGTRDGGPGGKPDGIFTADFEYVAGSGDLDECNGRFEVTPEFPQGTYAYHITGEFPWIGRSWKGAPDASFAKRRGPGPGPGPGGPGGGRRGPGSGPPPPFGPPSPLDPRPPF